METEEDKLWQDWDVLYEALNADVLMLERRIDAEDCDLWRRSYCRSIFALVEAATEWMKRYTVYCYYPGMLGEDEKKELERRNGALLGVFVALDLFADTSGAETPLKNGSKEWVVLHSAIEIRNRITHPKFPKDIEISDDDLSQLRATKEMFVSLVLRCFGDSALALIRQGEALQRAWDKSNKPNDPVHRIADKSGSR